MKNNLPHYRDKIKNLPVILFYENNLAEFYLVIQPRLFLKKAWAPRRSRGAWAPGGGPGPLFFKKEPPAEGGGPPGEAEEPGVFKKPRAPFLRSLGF